MDEREFRETLLTVNELPCVFAKAILCRCAGCSNSRTLFLAEREAVACLSPDGNRRCSQILILLHDKAMFSLHLHHPEQSLPHVKELQVQCGGLLGLHQTIYRDEDAVSIIRDIDQMLEYAIRLYGASGDLPFVEIVKGIAHFDRTSKNQMKPH